MQLTQNYSDQLLYLWNRALARAMAKLRNVGITGSLWRSVRRERRALMELDDRFLSDIGITRSQAVEEAKKPFWIYTSRQRL